MASAPGEFALLLGSGVSRAAGIPTGWEITLDLVRALANVQGEEVTSADAEEWYTKKFGHEPKYSEVLEQLGPTTHARQRLVRKYFEPQEDDAEGLKRPTRAHRAIAALVKSEVVKVIVTTNFDRLLEVAIQDAGIPPVVIASPNQVNAAMPLHRHACVVIKLHGDYLDSGILNVDAELASYPEPVNTMLDRVLDEHSLVVCGWSADYDTALREAFQRRTTRRYPMFWAHKGGITDSASQLVTLQGALALPIGDAESFFAELGSKVEAAAGAAGPHPFSEALVLAEAKRTLTLERPTIPYRDIAMRCLEETEGVLRSSGVLSNHGPVSAETVTGRLSQILEATRVLRRILALGTFFRPADAVEASLTCMRRLLALDAGDQSGTVVFIELKRAIPMSLHAAIGIAAVAADRFDVFARILGLPDPRSSRGGGTVGSNHYLALILEHKKLLKGHENNKVPMSEFFHNALRDEFREILPDDKHFDECFDRYEILTALAHMTPVSAATEVPTDGSQWIPPGRYAYGYYRDNEEAPWARMRAEFERAGDAWAPVSGGMFLGQSAVAGRVFAAAMPTFKRVNEYWSRR